MEWPAHLPIVGGGGVTPKLGTELFEFLEPVLDSPQTVWAVCMIIYTINYGLDVVGPEMAMDFGSIKWNRC